MKTNRPVAAATPEADPDGQPNYRAVFFFPDLMIEWPAGPAAAPPSVTLESVPEPPPPPSTRPADGRAEPPGTRRRQPDETPAYFVPRALAKRWHVCVDKVLRFIQTGELRAFNVASKESRRPRYRISMEEVRRFEEQTRSAAPPRAATSTSPRRRKSSSAGQSPRSYF
jgi:hypothetical protein